MPILLGKFNVTSGKVIVSDPVHSKDKDEMLVKVPVKNGEWSARATVAKSGAFKGRVTSLVAIHGSAKGKGKWEAIDTIDVDGGQAGIFDYDYYPETPGDYEEVDEDEPYESAKSFYSKASCFTVRHDFGIMDGRGAVSSSGLGDGAYIVKQKRAGKDVIGVKIDFKSDWTTFEAAKKLHLI